MNMIIKWQISCTLLWSEKKTKTKGKTVHDTKERYASQLINHQGILLSNFLFNKRNEAIRNSCVIVRIFAFGAISVILFPSFHLIFLLLFAVCLDAAKAQICRCISELSFIQLCRIESLINFEKTLMIAVFT